MWQKFKLADVCTLRNGRAYKKPELLVKGKYRVLRVGNFFTNRNWYYSDLELDDTKYCDNGDLLYAWSASFGARIWEGEKVIYHYHIWRVDINEEIVDKRFLFYWFEFDKELIKAASGTGTTMMHVSKSSMEKRDIILPSLAEQKIIVAKLDAAFVDIDKAIETVEYQKKEVQQVFEAEVRKYFLENVLVADVKRLSQVADYFNGLTYSPKDVGDEGIIVLRSSNIQNGKMHYADIVRVSKTIKEKLYVLPNDILVCSRNGSKALIGKSSLIGDTDEKMTFGTFMMIVRSEMNDYLQWFFKSSLFKAQIAQGENTAINQITRYMLDEVQLPIPSKDSRDLVSEKLQKLDYEVRELNILYERKLCNLTTLKAAILTQQMRSDAA